MNLRIAKGLLILRNYVFSWAPLDSLRAVTGLSGVYAMIPSHLAGIEQVAKGIGRGAFLGALTHCIG